MHRLRTATAATLAAALALAAAGCQEEGPAERAGRAIDEAADDAREGLRELVDEEGPLERAGREADEAFRKAKQETREALER